MNKESLTKVKNLILGVIENANISEVEKMELLINIYFFLDEDNYKENIEILKRFGKTNKAKKYEI